MSVTATFPESNPFGGECPLLSRTFDIYSFPAAESCVEEQADSTVITNGEANKLLIHLANGSKNNYTIVSAAASYHDPARNWALVRSGSRIGYTDDI